MTILLQIGLFIMNKISEKLEPGSSLRGWSIEFNKSLNRNTVLTVSNSFHAQ